MRDIVLIYFERTGEGHQPGESLPAGAGKILLENFGVLNAEWIVMVDLPILVIEWVILV